MKVKVKDMHSGDLGYMPLLTAIELWVNRKGIEIAREPDLAEYESDEEREQALRTIKGVWELKRQVPHGKAFIHDEEFDEGSQHLFEILRDEFFTNHPRSYQDEICRWVQANHSELNYSDETIKRKLRHIRKFGKLETDGNGFYALKAGQRREKENLKIQA